MKLALAILSATVALGVGPTAKAAATDGGQKAYFESLREESRELADFEERLFALRRREQGILERHEKKSIDRDEAKAKLLEIVEEEMKIEADPSYRVEALLHAAATAKQRRKESASAWTEHSRMQHDLERRLQGAQAVPGVPRK